MLVILNSICRELAKAFPTTPIHIQRIPAGFQRPCFLVEYLAGDAQTLNKTIVQDNMTFTVTYFEVKDDSGVVDTAKQLANADIILSLFKGGVLAVEGTTRFAKITGVRSGKQDQEFQVTLDLYYTGVHTLAPDDTVYELMQDLRFTPKTTTYEQ